jgi:hypothetical protein
MWNLEHLALGPVIWRRPERAAAKSPLEQSSWDRGVVSAARQYDDLRSPLLVFQVFAAGGTGLPLGNAVSGLPLIGQVLVGGLGAVAAFWAVPSLWAGFAAFRAPVDQRDEAREALRVQQEEASKTQVRLLLNQYRPMGEEASTRIGELRVAEQIEDDRERSAAISAIRAFDPLQAWGDQVQIALSQGGFTREAEECGPTFDAVTADELQAAWHRIQKAVTKTLVALG